MHKALKRAKSTPERNRYTPGTGDNAPPGYWQCTPARYETGTGYRDGTPQASGALAAGRDTRNTSGRHPARYTPGLLARQTMTTEDGTRTADRARQTIHGRQKRQTETGDGMTSKADWQTVPGTMGTVKYRADLIEPPRVHRLTRSERKAIFEKMTDTERAMHNARALAKWL